MEHDSASERPVVIAIDGPAGAGKSTIARRVAGRLGFTYIDTGAMYRAVALWALRQRLDPAESHKMEPLARAAEIELAPGCAVRLNGEDITQAIRTPEVAQAASQVAVIPGVRRALVEKQRALGARTSVVMEGRDIGSVVFPCANLKIFLDARAEERVRRRYAEDFEKGKAVTPESLAEQMRERDRRDSTRAEAPLVQAPDAVYVDSTGLSVDQVEDAILRLVRERISDGKDRS
jgi:cytidylate kinase